MKVSSGTGAVLVMAAVVGVMCSAPTAAAENWYVGGGLQTQAFGSDLDFAKWYRLSDDIGLNVNAGYRYTPRITIEAVVGTSNHRESESDTGSHHIWMEVGPKLYFNEERKIRYYAAAGLGGYRIDIDSTDYDGMGIYIGAGMEEFVTDRQSVDLYARCSGWSGSPNSLDVYSLSIGVNVNYLIWE